MTQIDELVIRIPGMDKEQGRSLGNEVAQLVAEALPEATRNYQVPELKIQMNASQLNGSASMASAIAQQIIRQIKLVSD